MNRSFDVSWHAALVLVLALGTYSLLLLIVDVRSGAGKKALIWVWDPSLAEAVCTIPFD